MTQIRSGKCRLTIAILMTAAIITGSILAGSGCDSTQPIEIAISETTVTGQITRIYIGGAVNNPGFYPLADRDSLESLIQAAGSTIDGADLSRIELHIAQMEEEETPQKIDINRAAAWLLEALPEIGEVKAQAIIDYRDQNGPFNNINELLKVKGIWESTLENIKDLITVAD
ncbi:helix-hairpin-helix domain-containing protein [Chloroflexota bacterium]